MTTRTHWLAARITDDINGSWVCDTPLAGAYRAKKYQRDLYEVEIKIIRKIARDDLDEFIARRPSP